MSGAFSNSEPHIRMLQQDWSELLTTVLDKKATCSLGMHELNQDWLSHHLGENSTASYIHAYFKVLMSGAEDKQNTKQENKRSHVIGFITGCRNNLTSNQRSKDTNLVTCIHDGQSSQELWSTHFARGAALATDPLIYVSAAESEQVVKLLQFVAGDIETNPGPMVSAFSSNI